MEASSDCEVMRELGRVRETFGEKLNHLERKMDNIASMVQEIQTVLTQERLNSSTDSTKGEHLPRGRLLTPPSASPNRLTDKKGGEQKDSRRSSVERKSDEAIHKLIEEQKKQEEQKQLEEQKILGKKRIEGKQKQEEEERIRLENIEKEKIALENKLKLEEKRKHILDNLMAGDADHQNQDSLFAEHSTNAKVSLLFDE